MKGFSINFKHQLQIYFALLCLFTLPCLTLGIEPFSTIGQPIPEKHAFLNNGTILRVVPTHIQIADSKTGTVIDEFGELTRYSSVKFSPSVEHIAILYRLYNSSKTTVNIWDVNNRQLVSEWEIADRISDDETAFSPSQPIFATTIGSEIHLWNWQNGETLGKIIRENMPSDRAMVFSADGRHLIVVANRSNIELWNVETQELEAQFGKHSIGSVGELHMSPDGSKLAMFAVNSNVVSVWDLITQQKLWEKWHSGGNIASITFSPDSKYLYVGNRWGYANGQRWNDQVRVWDVESATEIDVFETGFNFMQTLALSPDGKTALFNYWDAEVLWDIEEKKPLDVWSDSVSGWDTALSPDGQTLVSTSLHSIKVWDISSQELRLLISSENGSFRDFAISPDGQKLAVGRDPWIEIRDLKTGEVMTQFQYQQGITDINFSSTGEWLAVRYHGNIRLFNVENPEMHQIVSTVGAPKIDISSYFSFSDNDEYLAASTRTYNQGWQYWILLWKREGDQYRFQYSWMAPKLDSFSSARAVFSYDENGSIVLAVPTRVETQIWKLLPEKSELIDTIDVGFPVHFSEDGKYLFGESGRTLQILEWQTDTQLEHEPIPKYFDISQNGKVLASSDDTGQIQIWDASQFLPMEPEKPTAVEPNGKQFVPFGLIKRNQLLQNFPNPFNPETWIPFRLADESRVTINIYTPTGTLIRTLSTGTIAAGDYSSHSKAIHWDGRNDNGEQVSSGVYLYTINIGDFTATRKMLIRK